MPELLRVTLPVRARESSGEVRGVVIRIPEQGGLPPEHGEVLPRGLLLLRVELAEAPDPGVSRVLPTAPPPSSLQRLSLRLSLRAQQSLDKPVWLVAAIVAIVLLAGLAFLAFRRHRGLG